VLHVDDWYGPTYLLDLVLAAGYSDADVIGKGAPAVLVDGVVRRADRDAAYRPCEGLTPRRALITAEAARRTSASTLLNDETQALAAMRQFSIDDFDYCRDGAGAPEYARTELVGSTELDTGRSTVELYRLVAESAATSTLDPEAPMVAPSALADVITSAAVTVTSTGQEVRYTSTLAPAAVQLVWVEGRVPVSQIWPDGVAHAHLDCQGTLHLMFALRFFDASGAVVKSFTEPAGKLVEIEIPEGAVKVAFAIRVQGPGTSTIVSLALSHATPDPIVVGSRRDALLITDHYPSYDNLYRNGFIHTRVRHYREHGIDLDVFRPRQGMALTYHEFDSTEVASGSLKVLQQTIEAGDYRTILVHFLNEEVWEALRPFRATHRIVVWVHGAEIQPWWRRSWTVAANDEGRVKEQSERRLRFWREVLDDLPEQTTLVFVSQYFADQVEVDLERRIPLDNLRIIHNPVDCSLFAYHPKPAELRKKILSIRPYASATYANELSVQAVLELSKEPWFPELEFCFVGDGVLFEETLAPLREFPNVTIRQEFLKHDEIAALHREYGVFLVPTRSDTHGVSRDEAMASGLVPVTTHIAAVPEFISPEEGFLAQPEDHVGLAEAIAQMYAEPETFLRKSQAAAARVRRQASADVTIPAEVALIRGDDDPSSGRATHSPPA
jgi:glycosyltransferase involved in cell wall biosynthesis